MVIDDILSLRNFLCNLIRFWSSKGNLCTKKSRKAEENTKNENVSRIGKNVTRFVETLIQLFVTEKKTCHDLTKT